MPKKKRDLPEPPAGPFGRRRRQGEEGEAPQTADRLAMAMAEGRLEEYIEEEFGDIPNAKELAMTMLGATGMAPPKEKPGKPGRARGGKKKAAPKKTGSKPKGKADKSPEVPEALLKAAGGGDVEGLSALLSGELEKRGKGEETGKAEAREGGGPAEAVFEKGDIDTLMKVAQDNNASLDWVIARAIKLYARDYRTTGRI